MTLTDIPPGLILIIGALFVPFFSGRARNFYVIALPVIAFASILRLPAEATLTANLFPDLAPLNLLRVDNLSKAFGYIFTLNAFAAFIYAFALKDKTQHTAALLYVGSALGVVFAGDLITLYIFWEMMAITSTFLILARRTKKATGAAFRYVIIHIVGGLFLLAGIVLTINNTGSTGFEAFKDQNAGTWLMLLGFLVNAAAPPFSAWLSDAYPEATITGAVILSAYTTKTAVYTLIRGYPGWEILLIVGAVMAIYGIIYALLENDIRRILAYSIINQVGFMVCAVGVGTAIALNGAVAHAFSHILYKSLLWMCAGVVLQQLGRSKCTELGGLHKTMPIALGLGLVGAMTSAGMPLTSGFGSKSLILEGISQAHLFWPWVVLEVASAGVMLNAGLKFPYFVFFGKDQGLRPSEGPRHMLIAMGIIASLCILIGVYPQPLFNILPFETGAAGELITRVAPGTVIDFQPYGFAKVVSKLQLLLFAALGFFICLPWLKQTNTLTLDTDWFYRVGGKLFFKLMDRTLNPINQAAHRIFVEKGLGKLPEAINRLPAQLMLFVLEPAWNIQGISESEQEKRAERLRQQTKSGMFPAGLTALAATLFIAILMVIS